MKLDKKSFKSRTSPSASAGSMADIAFLLLIFFLVTTTIVQDKGLLVKLPMWVDDIVVTDVNERNVLTILVNADDAILSQDKLIDITELRAGVMNFIKNPERLKTMPAQPNKAVISLQNDRGTSYSTYLSVYSEIKGAYTDLWEEEAQKLYNKSYDSCDKDQRRSIRNTYPQVISEAEPTDYSEK